jgi:hypothetical protein
MLSMDREICMMRKEKVLQICQRETAVLRPHIEQLRELQADSQSKWVWIGSGQCLD